MNQPTPHNTPRIVSPEEAHGLARAMEPLPPIFGDLARTVATEPDRTRAAVVKALRALAGDMSEMRSLDQAYQAAHRRADAIENGAPFDV